MTICCDNNWMGVGEGGCFSTGSNDNQGRELFYWELFVNLVKRVLNKRN